LSSLVGLKKGTRDDNLKITPIEATKPLSKADSIVNLAIRPMVVTSIHKSRLFITLEIKHTVLKTTVITYTVSRYKRRFAIKDVMVNNDFVTSINTQVLNLTTEDAGKYGESFKPVIYFATLPYNRCTLYKTYIETTIKGKKYDVIKVLWSRWWRKRFDDEYMYWINKDTHKVDYPAYNYQQMVAVSF
jgi:hypothetical protein